MLETQHMGPDFEELLQRSLGSNEGRSFRANFLFVRKEERRKTKTEYSQTYFGLFSPISLEFSVR